MIVSNIMRGYANDPRSINPVTTSAAGFQNVAYPLSVVPLAVDASLVLEYRLQVEAYVQVLNRLLEQYMNSAQTRAWFALPSVAEDLIFADGVANAKVRVCRLDGYISNGGLKILENNADAPAGTLFTPRLNHFVQNVWGIDSCRQLPMDSSESPFVDLLVAAGRTDNPFIVILQTDKQHSESRELVTVLHRRGIDARIAHPCEIVAGGASFILDGKAIDVIWNKINTVAWFDMVEACSLPIDKWCRTLEQGESVHLNGFCSRFVAEAKSSLAYLQTPAFIASLPSEMRAAVTTLLPTCVALEKGTKIHWNGQPNQDLLSCVIAHRESFVLKQRYDIRGDGVTIGRAVDQTTWETMLRSSLGIGSIVQSYIEPPQVPVRSVGQNEIAMLRCSLDWFVFDGSLVGLGSKANQGYKVNLFQNGTKLAVLPVDVDTEESLLK